MLDDRGLLLVREIGETRWTLPGGWADVGETPRRAVEKEVQQEAGLDVSAARVLAVYDRDFRGRTQWPAHVYKLYVRCDVLGGEPKGDGLETEEASFFAVEELPSCSPKTPSEHLGRVLASRRPGTRRGARLSLRTASSLGLRGTYTDACRKSSRPERGRRRARAASATACSTRCATGSTARSACAGTS